MYKLPEDFYFGGATAAYQCEGATTEDGKGEVIWDKYLREKGELNPDPASDFYHKYLQDLELCHEFGINAIRVSISWARIFPEGYGKVEKRGVEYYHKLFQKCHEEGVEPFVTLHHFDTPQVMQDEGGWLSQAMLDHFVDYAKFCFDEFGSEVKYWITINEPTSMSSQQYIGGTFPPGIKYDFNKCFQAEYNMNLVHARIVELFKQGGYQGQIGVVHALQTVYPMTDSQADKHAADLQDALDNTFYLDGTVRGKYTPEVLSLVQEIIEANGQKMIEVKPEDEALLAKAAKDMDFVGVNYYFSKFMRGYQGKSEIIHNGTGEKGSSVSRMQGVGEQVNRTDIPATDWDWPIYPKGLYDQLTRLKDRFGWDKDVYITENGMGCKDKFLADKKTVEDDERIDYIKKHLLAMAKAMADGVKVKGYFVWSLQDMFSWTNGYTKRYGLFYVDFETQERYPKKSAYWYKKISETKEIGELETVQ